MAGSFRKAVLYRAAVWGISEALLDDVICIEVVVVVDMVVAEERVEDNSEKRRGAEVYYSTCISPLYCVGSYSVAYESLV
jgi:hypothetical protein